VELPVKEIVEVLTEFTWKKFFIFLGLLTALIVGLLAYEGYTSSFRLSRLQKSAELVAKLQEIDLTITNNSQGLQNAYQALVVQANEAIATKPLSLDVLPTTLRISMDTVWKFLAGGVLWFILGTFLLIITKDKSRWALFGGMVQVGVLTGFFAMWIPAVHWPWFHIFIFPFLFAFGVMVVVVPIVYVTGKIKANKKT
jgi:hypothetical protein